MAGTGSDELHRDILRGRVQLHIAIGRDLRLFALGGVFIWTWPAVAAGHFIAELNFAGMPSRYPVAGPVWACITITAVAVVPFITYPGAGTIPIAATGSGRPAAGTA